MDIDVSRAPETKRSLERAGCKAEFIATDINSIQLPENTYDLIYAVQSFHHFENLEHIMNEVNKGLTRRGYFVLDEFVGPRRFQWTDDQLLWTSQLLGLMPKHLRMYRRGIEKLAEGRSTVEQVISVCPSEAIRSDEIVPLFLRNFSVVCHQKLGGTIQHLLYSGIVHNFPDDAPGTDHLIDCVDNIETLLIEKGALPSDFALLIGQKV